MHTPLGENPVDGRICRVGWYAPDHLFFQRYGHRTYIMLSQVPIIVAMTVSQPDASKCNSDGRHQNCLRYAHRTSWFGLHYAKFTG